MSNFEWVTTAEVARRLDLPRREVVRLVKRGALDAKKLPGKTGALLFAPEAVDALAAERSR
jgi:excisionase family DNA binding protein